MLEGKSKPQSRAISRKNSMANSGFQGYDSDDSGTLSEGSGFEDLFEIERKRLHN